MTRRPARQPQRAQAPRVDDGPARTDGWLEGTPFRDRAQEPAAGYDSLLAATAASERRAIETASRTAAALGSVASWIERAQEQLTESTRAASRAQDQAASVLSGAVGTLGDRLSRVETRIGQDTSAVSSALDAIQRLESRLSETKEPRVPPAARLDESMRSLEDRLTDLSERISSVQRPIGRRGLAPEAEVSGAVAEIRAHQALLDRQGHAERPGPTLPALGTLARSQTAILTTMRADIAKLSTKLDTAAAPPAGELSHEVGTLRDSLGGLATRTDLDRLEKSIRSLTSDVADLRSVERDASTSHEMAALQEEIRRLAEARGPTSPVPASADIEILSHKLDILAASGVDPSVVSSLARQVDDVRQLLTGAGAPQALSLVSAHLDDLRREVAVVGGRQLPPDAFASLQTTLNDIRSSLTALGPVRPASPDVERAMSDFGGPIETMLASLADKVERVERRIHDPAALDGLQRQLADMAGRMGGQTRDPSIAGLERSVGELLREVAGLRDSTIEIAERAARSAVAETVGSMPVAQEVEQHLRAIREHYAAAENRTQESLAGVHEVLGHVMDRMASLEGPDRPAPDLHERRRPTADGGRHQQTGFDRGPGADDPEEVLLEPGAARPRSSDRAAEGSGRSEPALEGEDVRSNFIAAARRAAQAAQGETSGPRRKDAKAAAAPRAASGLSPADIVGKLRRMIDEKRRPLLLGAAALVLALGTLQLVRNLTAEAPAAPPPSRQISTSAQPAPIAPAAREPATSAAQERTPARSFQDPVTTQSIAPRAPSRPDERSPSGVVRDEVRLPAPPTSALTAPEKEPARIADAGSAAPTAPIPVPPSLARQPIAPEPGPALPLNIRQAALAGNPVALFDLAARTADGRGVSRDTKAALALFEKAADKGFAPAQYRIGNIYERGLGVPRDLDQARTWYRRAAEGGNVRAMHNLAVLTAEGGGAQPDYAQAIGWFTKAANYGVRDSQFNLAVLHARGLGTPQDLSKSYLWLAVAAAQGDEDAGRKRDEVGARLGATELTRQRRRSLGGARRHRIRPPMRCRFRPKASRTPR